MSDNSQAPGIADEVEEHGADASNLCYFVAVHEIIRDSLSNASSTTTASGPAPATPFMGLEIGPLLGKARSRPRAACLYPQAGLEPPAAQVS